MRFEHISIRDLGPFTHVDLDLAAISGSLIAVVGDNGAGKSTLLELLPGALYRATGTRGSLADLATSRSAMVEVRAVNGASYTVRQTVDAISGKGEALILDAQGEPLLSTGKVRDADAYVREHFPAPEVLYSSTFLAQQSEGFLELSPGERKQVLLRLLQGGIERLEGYAEAARTRARFVKGQVDLARGELAILRQRYPEVSTAERALEAAQAEVVRAEAECRLQRGNLAEAQKHARLAERAVEIMGQRAPIIVRIKELEPQVNSLAERIRNNKWLLSQQDEIRAAAALLEQQRTALQKLTSECDLAQQLHRTEARRAADLGVAAEKLEKALSAGNERLGVARARARDVARVEAAVAALPAHKAAVAEALDACRVLEFQIGEWDEALRHGKDQRIEGLREGLSAIAAPKKPHRYADGKVAEATLSRDDAAARAQKRGPGQVERLRSKLSLAESALEAAREKLDTIKQTAARAKDLKDAQAELDFAKARVAEAVREHKAGSAAWAQARQSAAEAEQRAQSLQKTRGLVQREIAQLEPRCKHLDKLEQAAARLEEQEPAHAQLTAQIEADHAALAALPLIEVPDGPGPVDAARLLDEAEQAERQAQQQLVHAQYNLENAREGADWTEQAVGKVREAELLLQDWTRLGQDCGKDGIQAYVIDACLPELTELANDLLHACFGSRFTLELRSSRDAADGTRVLEDLAVHVTDTVAGFAGPAERYSGGQRVILGEAIALALTMLACRIAGLSRPTLVRDESGAALSPENARAYVQMLRRAAQIVQADKILFVTHNPELQQLADARIEVKNGTAVVA